MKHLYVFVFLFCAVFALTAQQPEFEKANDAYTKGDFQSAIEGYENLLKAGWESPALYYNLGNSYYRSRKLGQAIWSYKKALNLDPKYQDAQHNLQLSERLTVDAITQVPKPLVERYFRAFGNFMGHNYFAYALALCTWLGAASFIMWRRNRLSWYLAGGLVFTALFGLLGISWGLYSYLISKEQLAVVISENVYVKTAPVKTSPDAFILHEGTLVEIEDQMSEWREIRLPDGQVGWLMPENLREL